MKEIIRVVNITKKFGGLKALNNVTTVLRRGEILGLIGPNGSGKTTLINVISGFYKPDAGKVFFNGEDITKLPPHKKVEKGIVRTFQLTKPFSNLSVFDNVMIGALFKAKDLLKARKKTIEILKELKLEKYSNMISKELPTGIKKRLEIARALAMEPKVLLLDEALAGLTSAEIDEMLSLIRSLRDEKRVHSILIVEHVIKAVMKIADRIIVLSSGELIAEGSPKEVANNSLVREVYLGKGEFV